MFACFFKEEVQVCLLMGAGMWQCLEHTRLELGAPKLFDACSCPLGGKDRTAFLMSLPSGSILWLLQEILCNILRECDSMAESWSLRSQSSTLTTTPHCGLPQGAPGTSEKDNKLVLSMQQMASSILLSFRGKKYQVGGDGTDLYWRLRTAATRQINI